VKHATFQPPKLGHKNASISIEAAASTAREAGRWETLGELYAIGAEAHAAIWASWRGPNDDGFRLLQFTDLAREALERAGKAPRRLQPLINDVEELRAHLSQIPSYWSPEACLRQNAPTYADDLAALWAAQYEGRDADDLGLASSLLQHLRPDTDPDQSNCALMTIARCVRLPGGERLIRGVCSAWRRGGNPSYAGAVLAALAASCTSAWSGRNDVLREGYYWPLNQYQGWMAYASVSRPSEPPVGWERFAIKLDAFGYKQEALSLVQRWLYLVRQYLAEQQEPQAWRWLWPSYGIVFPYRPPEARIAVGDLWSHIGARIPATRAKSLAALQSEFINVVSQAPSGREDEWLAATGVQLTQAALQFAEATVRTEALAEAAQLLENSGRADLAGQAHALAAELAQGNPQALLHCALVSVRWAVEDERWQDVVSRLEPMVTAVEQDVSVGLLETELLLEHAKRRLDKTEEADALLQRAIAHLGQLSLPPAER